MKEDDGPQLADNCLVNRELVAGIGAQMWSFPRIPVRLGCFPEHSCEVGVFPGPLRAPSRRSLSQDSFRPLTVNDFEQGVNQRQVGECVGEVADRASRGGIQVLAVEPEASAVCEEPLGQAASALELADRHERGDEPPRAERECLAGDGFAFA